MPVVPLGVQAYERQAGFQPEVKLVNLYMEKDESGASPDSLMRIQRPGLVEHDSLDERVTGLFQQDGVFSGDLFATTEKTFYRNGEVVGSLISSKQTVFAPGVGQLAFLADNTLRVYGGIVITTVTVPVGVPIDIDQLNGYVMVATASGRFYWIEPGATTIDPLNFATAESSQDGLVAVRRLGDEVWFFGTRSIEPWQATGDQDAPFQRAAGRQLDRGCLARDTVQRFDNSLAWVGENCVVYKAGAVPQRISTHGIEERLRKRSDLPSAWTYSRADGHLFYILNIPGQGTYAYDAATSGWSEWGSEGIDGWRARMGVDAQDATYAADYSGTQVWRLDNDTYTDGDLMIRRTVTGIVPTMGRPPRLDSFTVGMGASADCTVHVRWRDGRDSFPDYWEELDVRAPVDIATIYRLGSADQPFREFEIEIRDPVGARISGAMANEAWG